MKSLKLYLICYIIWMLWLSIDAQTGSWTWAKRAGGTDIEESKQIAVDGNGNSYVVGYFTGTAVFGTISITSGVGFKDAYIAKMDANGTWLWAKKAGGSGDDLGNAVTVDPSGTNIYIVGSFNSASIAFGGSTITLSRTTGSNNMDAFVAKINASGTWQWARKIVGTGTDNAWAVISDADSNVYMTGSFEGTATFGTVSQTSLGSSDIFVAKMDTAGNWVWAIKAGGANADQANGIVLDSSSNIFIVGGFLSTSATFGSYSITNGGSSDAFIAKMTNAGVWQWARKGGGGGYDSGFAITLDSNANAYITGMKEGAATFGTSVLTSSGGFDVFVAKMDASGNWIWASKAGGTLNEVGWDICVDSWSNIYLTGEFTGTTAFGTFSLTSTSTTSPDAFFARINSSGTWLAASRIGSTGTDVGKSVVLGSDASLYWLGNFTGTVPFGTIQLVSSNTSQDIYVAKQANTPLTLQSPNGGEVWVANTVHAITWSSLNITSVLLDYSTNNGQSWTAIVTSPLAASLGSYSWTIPNLNSVQTLIRVRNSSNAQVFDVSDAVFTLAPNAVAPQASFSADVTTGTSPLTVQFTDGSTAGTGTITSWAWNFGDATTSTLQNPSHLYQTAGVYTVSLTVTNSASLTNTQTRTGYITVTASLPQLDLLSADQLEFGSIDIGSQSNYQNVIIKNIGNSSLILSSIHFVGNPLNFQFQTPARDISISPGSTSTIQVRFSPQSAGLLRDTLFVVNNSVNQPLLRVPLSGTGVAVYSPPVATFTADVTTGVAPLSVQFTDRSLPVSGTIVSRAWSFGDGSTSTAQNPLHIYQSAGIYDVSLTVFNSYGLSNTLIRDDYITVTTPVATLSLLSGSIMNFGSINVGANSSYQSVTIKNTGTANLIISSIYFLAAPLHFNYIPPTGNIIIVPGGSGAVSVRFSPQSAGAQSDTLFLVNNSVNIPLAKVRLNGTGVAVNSAPQVSFSANVTSGIHPLTVQFTDQSVSGSGTLSAWYWDFGDGSTSTVQSPEHIYLSAGIYDVSLTATNSLSLSASLILEDYITVANPVGQLNLLTGPVIDFGTTYILEPTEYRAVSISNDGNRTIYLNNVYLGGNTPHFSFQVPEAAYILLPGETDSIFVLCNPQQPGSLIDELFIDNDSDNLPNPSIRLTARAALVPPKAPQNLLLTRTASDVNLCWDPVTQNMHNQSIAPEFYLVFVSGTSDLANGFSYHGYAFEPNYVHPWVLMFAPRMCYRVQAVEMQRGDIRNTPNPQDYWSSYLTDNLSRGISESEVNQILLNARDFSR